MGAPFERPEQGGPTLRHSASTTAVAPKARPANPTITLVVPARNEAENLAHVLPKLPKLHQLLLVDGHSTDATIATARALRPEVEVINQSRRGKGNALAAGFAAATGDVIVMFDADGSADASEIESYVQALVDGADFAKGSRFIPGGGSDDISGVRSIGNAFLNSVANALFGTRYSDLCYGYNAFWSDIVPMLELPDPFVGRPDEMHWGDGFEIETLINTRIAVANLRVTEVPSIELSRISGASNLNAFRDGFRVLRTIVAENRRARLLKKAAAGRPQRGGEVGVGPADIDLRD